MTYVLKLQLKATTSDGHKRWAEIQGQMLHTNLPSI